MGICDATNIYGGSPACHLAPSGKRILLLGPGDLFRRKRPRGPRCLPEERSPGDRVCAPSLTGGITRGEQ
jgi:hypothetical protein